MYGKIYVFNFMDKMSIFADIYLGFFTLLMRMFVKSTLVLSICRVGTAHQNPVPVPYYAI
jgi:hypothetical protein